MLARLLPLLLLATPLHAQTVQTQPRPSELKAPFGLHWGDSTQRIQAALKNSNATIAKREEHQGRTRWIVDGIKQENLSRTLFYFEQGALSEIELEYQNRAWNEGHYNAYLGKLRSMLARRLGPGELLERSKQPFDDITQTIVGYRWKSGDTIVELVYFCAEKTPESYRSVSLHYRVAN